jgi:N-acylneuraminate cytidylyltransferase
MYSLGPDDRVKPLFPELNTAFRRQELPKTYVPNGAIYVFDLKWFHEKQLFITDESVAFIMPAERSVDVDTALDLALADVLLTSAAFRG